MTTLFIAVLCVLILLAGIRLSKTGRYPAFYFSLCLLSIAIYVLHYIANDLRTNSTGNESFLTGLQFLDFLRYTFYILIAAIFIISISNLFIAENKRSVKIVSGIVIGLFIISLGVFIYFIAIFSKIGG